MRNLLASRSAVTPRVASRFQTIPWPWLQITTPRERRQPRRDAPLYAHAIRAYRDARHGRLASRKNIEHRQLPWVKNPTQGAHAEQQNYLQYSLYCHHNRKLECLQRLAEETGDPLFAALYERILQCVFWTQERKGDLMGAMYERIADPWNARGEGYESLGTLYLNELSLDAMLQLLDMGVAKAPARR